jgi:hypothetical protein
MCRLCHARQHDTATWHIVVIAAMPSRRLHGSCVVAFRPTNFVIELRAEVSRVVGRGDLSRRPRLVTSPTRGCLARDTAAQLADGSSTGSSRWES